MNIIRLARDRNGAVLVEVAVMMTIMFVFILGSIEFLFAFSSHLTRMISQCQYGSFSS